jgi:hypothetical protein
VIDADFEQEPPEGFAEIEIPYPVPDGAVAFEIVGDSMWPRYDPGDIVICWKVAQTRTEADGWEAAVRLTDGRVLVVGGDGDPDHRTAEIYVPSERRYVGAGALRVMRDQHTATLLGDGTVLIAGGSYDDTSLELFGPSLPPPASLQMQPGSATIATGGSQSFSAVDDLGRTRLDAIWTISDTTVASLQFAAGLPTVRGLNPGQVTLTAEIEGVQAQAAITVTPASLKVTPSAATLLVGQTRQFRVVDERGRPNQLATWSISDTSLATISVGAEPELTAAAAGTVTLTATVLGVSAQAVVTIVEGNAVAPGTVLWSAPAPAGFTATGIVHAVPSLSGPAVYSIQESDGGGVRTSVEAYSVDGMLLWQRTFDSRLAGKVVADANGGLLLTLDRKSVV